jgi:hypothetical protein
MEGSNFHGSRFGSMLAIKRELRMYLVLVMLRFWGERGRKGTDLKYEPLLFLLEVITWVSKELKRRLQNAVVPEK